MNPKLSVDDEYKEIEYNPSNLIKRKQKTRKIIDEKEKQKPEELEKYEEVNRKIKTKFAIKSILEMKDYYIHQQDTQMIFTAEIIDLEQELDQKQKSLLELKKELNVIKFIKNNYVIMNNIENGEKVMVPETRVDFWRGHRANIEHLKERIVSLK